MLLFNHFEYPCLKRNTLRWQHDRFVKIGKGSVSSQLPPSINRAFPVTFFFPSLRKTYPRWLLAYLGFIGESGIFSLSWWGLTSAWSAIREGLISCDKFIPRPLNTQLAISILIWQNICPKYAGIRRANIIYS